MNFENLKQKFKKLVQKSHDIDYTEDRKYVSSLYSRVIEGKINVRKALLAFPKDCEDVSINIAWHALCYYEADEDIRAKDKEYAEVQDDYIVQIRDILKEGKELPVNIINSYRNFYTQAQTPHSPTIIGLMSIFERFINIKK